MATSFLARVRDELLADVPLFRSCTTRELGRIARLATRVVAQPGDVMTEEGRVGSDFFVIERGDAEVTVGGRHVNKLREGDSFGEIALLDEGPRSATVTATSEMVLCAIAARDFAAFLDESPTVMLRILQAAAQRLRAAEHAPTYKRARY